MLGLGDTPYGWSWNGQRWTHKRVPVNIWSPMHEGWDYEAIQKKYKRWSETPDGQALDAFVEHFNTCKNGCGTRTLSHCEVRDVEDRCPEGDSLWAELTFKWRSWLYQLREDHMNGKQRHARS